MKGLLLAAAFCAAASPTLAQLLPMSQPLQQRSLPFGVSVPAVTSSSVSYPGCPGEVMTHTNTWYFDQALGQTQSGGGLGTIAHPWKDLQALTGNNAGTPFAGYTQILLSTAPGGNGSSPVVPGDLIIVNTGSYGTLALGASTAIVNSPAITIQAGSGQTPLFTGIAISEFKGLHLEKLKLQGTGASNGALAYIADNHVAGSTSDIILENMDISSAPVATWDGWTQSQIISNGRPGVGAYSQAGNTPGTTMTCISVVNSHIYAVISPGLAGGIEGGSSSMLLQGNEIDHLQAPAINYYESNTAIGYNFVHDFVETGVSYQHYAIENQENGIITPSLYQSNVYLYNNKMIESIDAGQTFNAAISFYLNSCGDITNFVAWLNLVASNGAAGIDTGNLHNFLVANNSIMYGGGAQTPEINLSQSHCGSTGPYGNAPSNGWVFNNIAPIFNNANMLGVQTYHNIAAPGFTGFSVWNYPNNWSQVFVSPTPGSVITLSSISGQQNLIDGGVGGASPQANEFTAVPAASSFPLNPQPDWAPKAGSPAMTVGGVQLVPPITDYNGTAFTAPYAIGAISQPDVAGQGWLSEASCSSNFALSNVIPYSNTFTSWHVDTSSGVTAPVITTGITDPLGGTTASQVAFSPVTAALGYGVIDISTSIAFSNYPITLVVWAKLVSNTGTGTAYATVSHSTTFARAAITASSWTPIVVSVPSSLFGVSLSEQPQIGINLNDAGESASNGTITVDLWGAIMMGDPTGKYLATQPTELETLVSGVLATSGSAASATVSLPCPAHMAWRDFSPLTPSPANPSPIENVSNAWESGGVSNPYISSSIFSGGYYWGFANATSSNCHGNWMSFNLYKSTDQKTWTEDTTNAPYLQTYGSSFAGPSCTIGTGTASFWQLHPAWLPYGCTISTPTLTTYPVCVVYGAEQTNGTSYNTFIAGATAPNAVYTPAGCTAPGTCSSPTPFIANTPTGTPVGGGAAPISPNLPTVINYGGSSGTNYLVTAAAGVGNSWMQLWSMPATPTITQPQWYGVLMTTPLSTEWDTGSVYIDPAIIAECGFYEIFYTAYNSGGLQGSGQYQAIGYGIAPIMADGSPGPVWKYSAAPIVPYTSAMYYSTHYIGDSSPVVSGGQFIWWGNYDNGTTQSRAVSATMPQGTCPA